jgi:hypothetical protein
MSVSPAMSVKREHQRADQRTDSPRAHATAGQSRTADESFAVAIPVAGLALGTVRTSASADPLGGTAVAPGIVEVLRRRRGAGQPLDGDTAARMSQALGADLGAVRVHHDGEAEHLSRSVQAKAFTYGSDIYFARGGYAPGTSAGDHLLAHELAHVTQPAPAAGRAASPTIGRANDAAEADADRAADMVVQRLRRQSVRAGDGPAAERDAAPGVVSALRRWADVDRAVDHGDSVLRRALGDAFDWAGAGSIKRSGEGAEGVIFVTSAGGEIVIKFLKAAAGANQADETLRATGVEVPDSRIVKNTGTDPIGSQVRTLINAKLATLTPTQQTQVTTQMTTYRYIQLQAKTVGVALDKFNTAQVKSFIEDAGLLQEVGKIAAVDSFLGNTDRLSKALTNTGNYMLQAGVTGPTLVAIDNEMKAKVASKKAAREGEVRFIMSDAGVDLIAMAFLMKLSGSGTKYMFSQEDQAFVKQNIKLGVKAGAEAIAQLMQDQPGFIDAAKQTEKTQLPGPEGTKTKKREIVRATLEARVAAMQDEYVKGSWARLAPALAL